MFRSRFLFRLYAGYAVIVLITTGIVSVLVGRSVERNSLEEIERELSSMASLLAEISAPEFGERSDREFAERVRLLGSTVGTRLTVIAVDGTVIADSEEDPALMDNHGTRPEVLDARERGSGKATRFSDTLDKKMMYLARAVRRGEELIGYARVSLPLTQVDERVTRVRAIVALGAAFALAIGFVIGFFFVRRTTKPLTEMAFVAHRIASGEYEQRVRIEGKDEIARLADSFNRMADELEKRVKTITFDRNKLLAVLGGMGEGVIAVDHEERVLHMNSVAGKMLRTDPEASLGRPIWEVTRIREIPQALAEAARLMTAVKGRVSMPAHARDRVIELHSSPLKDATGETSGAVVILNDVTEMQRLEKVRRDFVANVSHELKTPLAAMHGLIETILEDRSMDAETQRRFLSKIRGQTARLSTLVNDLLALSRMESQELELERELLDLRDVVEQSVSSHESEGRTKGLRVEVSVPETRVTVAGDGEALREIVDNLVNNAIRYTPAEGSVWVRLKLEGKRALIEVEDTGIGIEPKDQERIFERFYRVDKHRSRELGGTGLGLSIVRNVAKAHGGEVFVESAPGRGSTFRVWIPLAPASL